MLKRKRRAAGAAIIAILLMGSFTISTFATDFLISEKTNTDQRTVENSSTESLAAESYETYLNAHSDWAMPIKAIELLNNPIAVQDNQTIMLSVDVPENSCYQLRLQYRYADHAIKSGNVSLYVDDHLPFTEAENLKLLQYFENDGDITEDTRGNDILPSQQVSQCSVSYTICDNTHMNRILYIALAEGQHTISLIFKEADLTLTGVELYNEEIPSYSEYRSQHSEKSSDFFEQIQAEKANYRSSSSLVPTTDRSGPETIPSDPTRKKLNVLSADRWNEVGTSATWILSVPEDGVYQLGLRWRQNQQEGLFSSRRLLIDGSVPFLEADAIKFIYGSDWQYTFLGDETPYEFYLTAGEHTLTLEAVSGEMTAVVEQLQNTVYHLNTIYRRIIMITGVSPDSYRDYDLFSAIDGLKESFEQAARELQDIVNILEQESGLKGGQISTLEQLVDQLKDFSTDDMTIPKRLNAFKSNISATASLMATLQQQPLDLDYLTISGTGSQQQPEGWHIGWWKKFSYHFQAFLGSFFNDYTAIGDSGTAETSITAWYSGGREQAEILKQMIDEDFTIDTGIGVDLQLVTISLSQAIMAGTAPDVVLSTSRGQPVNLGIRGVLLNLEQMSGFAELKQEYTKQAFVPYTYRNEVYGIPVTMNFHMMFVRTDVFEELGLSIPQTWREFDNIIATLQRANMTIGLPYSVMSSQASIESGMGCKDIFSALLLQNNGRIYNNELTATVLNEEATMQAFKTWTNFYTEYQLDTEYNFYNRFRTGEMPIGIADYSFYNTLQAATPELKGLWTMVPIPGTVRQDGVIDRSEATSGTACVILKNSKAPEEAWKFTKWWCSANTQARFGNEIELLMGEAARYAPANLTAMKNLPWTESQLELLYQQVEWLDEIPEVIGGYYTARGMDNAFRNVLFNGANYREALLEQMNIINTELARKQKEFAQ